jgi:hypothetical protein
MTILGWWLIAAGALAVGAVLGAWFASTFATRRVAVEHLRQIDALEQKHTAAIGQARSAHLRLQAELEQTRNNFKRQLLAAASEPRAELARAESKLKIAYAELDRLRDQLDGPRGTQRPDLSDGFAATQPMPDDR